MNEITTLGGAQTMSSREIAELCEKEHRHVLRDIREMLIELHGEGGLPRFGHSYMNAQNKPQPEFLLPKRETLILVSGYRLDLRAKIIDRWQELEAQAQAIDPRRALSDPATLRTLLLQNVEKVIALEGQVEEMRPQVQALERIAITEGSMCITDAAKTLQVRPKALFDYLRQNHWIYRRMGMAEDIAYQDKLQQGLLEHKVTVVTRADGSEKTTTQVRVTPKGITKLAKLFPPVASVA